MSLLSSTPVRHYVVGLLCTGLGAWLTAALDSLLPLAFGGAVLVMTTIPLIRAIRRQHAAPPDRR